MRPLFPPFLLVNLIYQVVLCNSLRHFVYKLLKSIFLMEIGLFLKDKEISSQDLNAVSLH